jgi:hypothetical protein
MDTSLQSVYWSYLEPDVYGQYCETKKVVSHSSGAKSLTANFRIWTLRVTLLLEDLDR